MSRIEEALKKAQQGEGGEAPPPAAERPSKRRRSKDDASRLSHLASVRTNLQLSLADIENPCVLFCSALPGEGVTTILYYLSQLIAAGEKTLVIDSNFLNPSLHNFFELRNDRGLSDIYLKKASLESCVQSTRFAGLDLLTAGPDASDCYRFVGSEAARDLIEDSKQKYEFVLIDAPPVRNSPDTVTLGSHSDGVVLIVRARKTKKQIIQYVQSQFANSGANEIGVVLNRMKYWVPGFIYRRL